MFGCVPGASGWVFGYLVHPGLNPASSHTGEQAEKTGKTTAAESVRAVVLS